MQKISVFSRDNKLDNMIHFSAAYRQIKQKKSTTNESSEAMDQFGRLRLIAAESMNATASAAN